jgi:lysophospholipase L1-like esterase
MSRERLFTAITLIAAPVLIGLALELFVRVALDDGMQFDLEMWKYSNRVKRIAADRQIGHEHRPEVHAFLMGVNVAINRHKLRDREIGFERTPNTFRMLMLGDSLTFGWGVPIERTFVKRLEAMITAAGIKAEVINAGVGNYNTSMEVAYYMAEGYRYQPDVVVLNYFINDAEKTPRYDISWLESISAGYVYLNSHVDALMRMLRIGAYRDWHDYLKDLYDPSKPISGWDGVETAFARFAAFSRERETRAVVINLPELRRLKPYPFEKEETQVRMLAKQDGLPYLNALAAVADLEPRRLWVTRTDPHPNDLAHERIATAIFEFLRSHDLLRINRTGT